MATPTASVLVPPRASARDASRDASAPAMAAAGTQTVMIASAPNTIHCHAGRGGPSSSAGPAWSTGRRLLPSRVAGAMEARVPLLRAAVPTGQTSVTTV